MTDDKSPARIIGPVKLTIIITIIFSLGFLPIVLFTKIFFLFIDLSEIWHLFIIPFYIYFAVYITLWYQLLISGLFIHICNIKYKPGTYPYNFKNKMSYKWIIICMLYTPFRNLLEIFPMGAMKYRYYKLLGMKIGKNTLVGGTIMDPCLTEFGDNCTMGLFSVIYGHIHDYEKESIFMDKIKIGNNVVIGAGAYVMPGAVIQDNVKIAAGAVVTKGQVLKKNRIYAGIPAKEIKKINKII